MDLFGDGFVLLRLGNDAPSGKPLLDEIVEFHKQAKEGLVQGTFAPDDNVTEDTDKM